MKPEEFAAIEQNLFEGARWVLREQPAFPWHRDGNGRATAAEVQSSQALALDVFATIERLDSRDAVMECIGVHLGFDAQGPWSLTPEALVPKTLLGEPRPTQIDILGRAARSLVLFECKFTEPDGGACSQPVPIRKGSNTGLRQCNGNYQVQRDPISSKIGRCTLTGKGIRYWELVPQVLRIDPEIDHLPCPFDGGWYQWMRNLVSAAAMADESRLSPAFVIVYADGPFAMPRKLRTESWREFTELLTTRVPLRVVSYQQLLSWAVGVTTGDDQTILRACSTWVDRKIAAAAR
jgi:hypothetical protein